MSKLARSLDVGKMALDGFGQVMDTMDFVKRAWTTFNLPTPFAPTLSVEELDKRITDLRAVEQWITLNQNMLRNTIQGLEIQRGTLNAVRNLSDSIGKAVKPADETMAQTLAQYAAAAAQQAASATPVAEPSPFSAMPSLPFAFAPPPPPPPAAQPAARPAPSPQAGPAAGGRPAPEPLFSGLPASAANPLAWWNLLQSNFQQIAEAAAASQAAASAAVKGLRKSVQAAAGSADGPPGAASPGTGAAAARRVAQKASPRTARRPALAGGTSTVGKEAKPPRIRRKAVK